MRSIRAGAGTFACVCANLARMRVQNSTVVVFLVGLLAFSGWAQDPSNEYRVGAGDVLRVEGFEQEEISGEFPVEGSGAMTFPLLGDVPVSGLTTFEVARLLEQLLEKDFYVDVQLQIEVSEYRSQPVTVLGEVARPGTYYLRGQTSLMEILSEAGGIRPAAGAVLEVRRKSPNGDQIERRVLRFDTAKVVTGESGTDTYLQLGDVISVSARQLYFIHGEVARPGQYDIARGLTLMQAISQAGGLGKFASRTIEVHREADDGKEILDFDLAQIRKGKVDDPLIHHGDVIIIKRRFL